MENGLIGALGVHAVPHAEEAPKKEHVPVANQHLLLEVLSVWVPHQINKTAPPKFVLLVIH